MIDLSCCGLKYEFRVVLGGSAWGFKCQWHSQELAAHFHLASISAVGPGLE